MCGALALEAGRSGRLLSPGRREAGSVGGGSRASLGASDHGTLVRSQLGHFSWVYYPLLVLSLVFSEYSVIE